MCNGVLSYIYQFVSFIRYVWRVARSRPTERWKKTVSRPSPRLESTVAAFSVFAYWNFRSICHENDCVCLHPNERMLRNFRFAKWNTHAGRMGTSRKMGNRAQSRKQNRQSFHATWMTRYLVNQKWFRCFLARDQLLIDFVFCFECLAIHSKDQWHAEEREEGRNELLGASRS